MNKETVSFNTKRNSIWIDKLNNIDSRLFLMMGMKQDKSVQVFCDDIMTPAHLVQRLREYADNVEKGNYKQEKEKK